MPGLTRHLDTRYIKRDQVVNQGVAKATPTVTSWDLGHVRLEGLRIRIPPGPSGLAGINISYAGVSIAPSEQPGEFWVGDDEIFDLDVGVEITLPLTLTLYNTDIYPHTFYLSASVKDMVLVTAGAVTAGETILATVPGSSPPSDAALDAALAESPPELVEPLGVPASVGEPAAGGPL